MGEFKMLDYALLGKRIRDERKRQKMTQQTLAELCDISLHHVASFERAKTKMSMDVFLAVCNVLKVSPAKLLVDSLQMQSTNEIYNDIVTETFADCSDIERKILVDMLQSDKAILRKRLKNLIQESYID